MREKMKRLPAAVVILIAVAVVVGDLLVLNVLTGLLYFLIPQFMEYTPYSAQMVAELLAGLYAFGMLCLFGYAGILKKTGEGWHKSLYVGGFMIGYCCYALVGQLYVQMMNEERQLQSLPAILIFIVAVFLVGWSEELVFRGTVFNLFLDRFPNTRGGVLAAVIVNGVLFGAVHLVNLLAGASLVSVLVQMLTAALLGMLLAIIYVRSENIWIVIFAHALIDFASLFGGGILGEEDLVSGINSISASNLVAVPVLLIPFLILARRSKLDEVVRRRNGETVDFTAGSADSIAIVSLVLGIVGLVFGCIGVGLGISIVGILAATLAKKYQTSQRGIATAGLVLSIIGVVVAVLMTILLSYMYANIGDFQALLS